MTRESEIENYLVERVKALGGEVRKVKWIGRNSAPDRVVMLPGTPPIAGALPEMLAPPRMVWVELKAPGLAALFPHTPHERKQHREHERMRKMGQRVVVIDSFEGVDEVLA
jgi:hypothetical protein